MSCSAGLDMKKSFITSGPEVDISTAGLEVIKLYFSCSTQLSTKFQLLITTKIPKNKEVYALSLSDVVYIMLLNV